jgi:hypothetical protein
MIDFADEHLKIDGAIATEESVVPRLISGRRCEPTHDFITLTIEPAVGVDLRLDKHSSPAIGLTDPSLLTTHSAFA